MYVKLYVQRRIPCINCELAKCAGLSSVCCSCTYYVRTLCCYWGSMLMMCMYAEGNKSQQWIEFLYFHYWGCRGGSVAVSVMMLSKSYGMFWVQTQPCTPMLCTYECCDINAIWLWHNIILQQQIYVEIEKYCRSICPFRSLGLSLIQVCHGRIGTR